MFGIGKSTARRAEIRRNRPEPGESLLRRLRAEGVLTSAIVAGLFCIAAATILCMRQQVVRYRPGQWTHHDIISRVDFSYRDDKLLAATRQRARAETPRHYRIADSDPWRAASDALLAVPDRVRGMSLEELPEDLRSIFDAGSLSKLQEYQSAAARRTYEQMVQQYIAGVRALGLVILPEDQRAEDLGRLVVIEGVPDRVRADATLSPKSSADIVPRLTKLAEQIFPLALQPKVLALTARYIAPTHVWDDVATVEAQNRAAESVPASAGDVTKKANNIIVDVGPQGGEIEHEDWLLLKAENDAYLATLGPAVWGQRAGIAAIVVLATLVASVYIARYQPRVVRNHARAIAIGCLMLAMLLLAQLAALGTSSLYFFGLAPTLLVAMILTIAYEQRFALGMATFHAVLVTLALDADVSFLFIIETGVVTSIFLLDDLRTRSKLIEVGGLTACALIAATAAAGLVRFDPITFMGRNCLYAGAAGLAVGFVVLGILPFIEKAFRITTSMTLLELADVSQPLLRRLSMEAPGTYNHSLQVATLAEEAAEAIAANGLLCRVAAYYHDVGKINKAEYFIENQIDGQNRHINLSPSVSLLIIIGHVKDGIELAREYNLPTSLFPFIQQHHGTTLVEFFYQRACDTAVPDTGNVSETQYRYPGPKPKTKEIAILMLADAVESAARTMAEPTASRIEALVHEIAMKRLSDGQFDESDLTMRELELIERSLVKTLAGIYHGRIAYPSTSAVTSASAAQPASKTA